FQELTATPPRRGCARPPTRASSPTGWAASHRDRPGRGAPDDHRTRRAADEGPQARTQGGAPPMAKNVIRVGNVEIMALSDGMLEFDLCNFFPTIPNEDWRQYESLLTEEHKVRFNLGSYLIRADGRTILIDTGLGPKPADAPDAPWGQ